MEVIKLNNAFAELTFDESIAVDGGSIAQALYLAAGIVTAVWTPIISTTLTLTGVGIPAAIGTALVGAGAATYFFGMASHS